MASNWGTNWGTNWGDNWGATGVAAIVQPVLRIRAPKIRTIDAKSIADRFNQGQPLMPDYEWPGRRKFFQKPPDKP